MVVEELDSANLDLTPIQKFYDGATVFITGSTGFLGNILVEKLLRSCPTISHLYLLVRKKKGKYIEERLEAMFEDDVFKRLKEECPNFRQKVVGVAGDCSEPGLGLSLQDNRLLIDEANIVFHLAATVRFDENIKTAVEINIRGPRDLLDLAKKMKKLKSFVHVSTVYANCPEKHIEEKVYPPPMDGKKLILITDNFPEQILNKMTPRLLGKYPNTYAFTKQIAEDLVKRDSENIPLGIFRPSIVVSTYKEPIPAWINNLYGPTGVCAAAGVGLLRVLYANKNMNTNIVPVDMCVNAMVASAWQVEEKYHQAVKSETPFEIPVYNYESNSENPLKWGVMLDKSVASGIHYPTDKAIFYYSLILCKSYPIYLFLRFFLHTIPAFLIDSILLCLRKKPRLMKNYKKLHTFTNVISYFALRAWTLQSDNVNNLFTQMSDKDRDIFAGDLRLLDWNEFLRNYFLGVRTYLLKDPLDTLDAARIKWNRLYYVHQFTKFLAVLLVLYLVTYSLSWL